MITANDLIQRLDLAPHPEGGHYRQTWVQDRKDGLRPAGTCIFFLLAAGEHSHWHRVDAVEIWHYYAGAPLILHRAETEAGPAQQDILGPGVMAGQMPQLIVPEHHWQAAETTGDWTLVGCTVSPGFQFEGFDLAPEGFHIPG